MPKIIPLDYYLGIEASRNNANHPLSKELEIDLLMYRLNELNINKIFYTWFLTQNYKIFYEDDLGKICLSNIFLLYVDKKSDYPVKLCYNFRHTQFLGAPSIQSVFYWKLDNNFNFKQGHIDFYCLFNILLSEFKTDFFPDANTRETKRSIVQYVKESFNRENMFVYLVDNKKVSLLKDYDQWDIDYYWGLDIKHRSRLIAISSQQFDLNNIEV